MLSLSFVIAQKSANLNTRYKSSTLNMSMFIATFFSSVGILHKSANARFSAPPLPAMTDEMSGEPLEGV